MKYLLLTASVISICLLAAAFTLSPSSFTINGVVKDKNTGDPLPGVSIIEKGTKKGTLTDSDGKFTLESISGGITLVVSYPGYTSQEVPVKNRKDIEILLSPAEATLDEVVVTGYESKKRESVTGSVASVSKSTSADRRVSSTLEGKVAGVSLDKADYIREKPLGPGNKNPQARILTAGEWNDWTNWDYWMSLMKNQQWRKMQDHWKMNMCYGIQVQVTNKSGLPMVNKKVTIRTDGQKYWETKTGADGTAILWPDFLEEQQVQQYVVEVYDNNNKVIGSKTLHDDVTTVQITTNDNNSYANTADIMFVIDATGSMGDEIDYLKAELKDIISKIETGKNQTDTRVGMVFYRDHGDEYIIRDFDFSKDIKTVQANLDKQSANGGGDYEEAVEEALQNAILQQRWNENAVAKVMFLILDAPPHYDAQRVKAMQQNIENAAKKGIRIIPVVASGVNKETEFLMRFMALATNGTYVFLTDDSGVGNSHLKPTIGKYNVEYLNDLIVRLVKQYTTVGLPEKVAKNK